MPMIEATTPKTTVPMPLGPHCESCGKLREVMGDVEVLMVGDSPWTRVWLVGGILVRGGSIMRVVDNKRSLNKFG